MTHQFRKLGIRIALLCVIWLVYTNAWAQTTVFVTPKVDAPYDAIFENIIKGYQQRSTADIKIIRFGRDAPSANALVSSQIDRIADVKLIVPIGNDAYDLVKQLNTKYPVLGVLVNKSALLDNDLPILSIHTDPRLYVQRIRQILPDTKKIIYIHHIHNKSLGEIEKKITQKFGMAYDMLLVNDLEDALVKFNTLSRESHPNTVFVISRDVVSLNTDLLFPILMDYSWRKGVPMVSETLSHVKRGFLFSYYPDLIGVGHWIASINPEKLQGEDILQLNSNVSLSINTRTASHLGISNKDIRDANAKILFPSR